MPCIYLYSKWQELWEEVNQKDRLSIKKEENENSRRPIYFVGAGPGDPELLTLKAKRLLSEADVIVYTGSLVPKSVLEGCRAQQFNSAGMHLDQVMEILIGSYKQGLKVVRLHTGDPSLYSAITEQIVRLKKESIPYKVVPGVTSGFAACASLGVELTIPEQVQTVIISRISGRTLVPEKESLDKLSKIGASLILYLSISHMERVVEQLLCGYPGNTPVAVVEKATWPEERIVKGTLDDIAHRVRAAGIKKTAVIIVGSALEGINNLKGLVASKLYNKKFSHEYRRASCKDQRVIKAFCKDSLDSPKSEPTYIIYLGEKGRSIAQAVREQLGEDARLISYSTLKNKDLLAKCWKDIPALIFVCACQIAVRTIAPFLKDKYTDPAVVSVDESGKNVVCLLSGHIGGGNQLAQKIAQIIGARAIITTQSDILNIPPLDLWAKAHNLVPSDKERLKDIQARFRNGHRLKVFGQNLVVFKGLPEGLQETSSESEADIVIGPFVSNSDRCLHLVTRNLCLGTGCHKGLAPTRLLEKLEEFLNRHSIHPYSIKKVCTIDKKADELAIIELARHLGASLHTFTAYELNNAGGTDSSPLVLRAVGAKAVAEPSAILCCDEDNLLIKKEKFDCCTFSLAGSEQEITDKY